MRTQLEDVKIQLGEARNECSSLKEQIETGNQHTQELKGTIGTIATTLPNSPEEIKKKYDNLEQEKNKLVEVHSREISEADDQRHQLRTRIQTLESSLEAAQTKFVEEKAKLDEMQRTLFSQNEQIDRTGEQLEEAKHRTKELEAHYQQAQEVSIIK